MEFIVVDRERINIYLTCAELAEDNFTETVLSDPKILKRKLKRIFERAKRETGFKIENIPLEVEVIPILDGDLFISVKRLGRETEYELCHAVFTDSEQVILLCHQLENYVIGKNELYLYDGVYHFLIYVPKDNQYLKNYIYEFGLKSDEKEIYNVSEYVLKEHGKLICEQNCVEMFTKNFF